MQTPNSSFVFSKYACKQLFCSAQGGVPLLSSAIKLRTIFVSKIQSAQKVLSQPRPFKLFNSWETVFFSCGLPMSFFAHSVLGNEVFHPLCLMLSDQAIQFKNIASFYSKLCDGKI